MVTIPGARESSVVVQKAKIKFMFHETWYWRWILENGRILPKREEDGKTFQVEGTALKG